MIEWESSSTKQILLIVVSIIIIGLLSPYFGVYLFFGNPHTQSKPRQPEGPSTKSIPVQLPNKRNDTSMGLKSSVLRSSKSNRPKEENSFKSLLQIEDLLEERSE